MNDQLKPVKEVYGTTVGTTVAALPGVPTSARMAFLQVENEDVRIRYDGTMSVTSGPGGGMKLFVNTVNKPVHIIEGWDFLNRARICADAGEAVINVVYLGYEIPS